MPLACSPPRALPLDGRITCVIQYFSSQSSRRIDTLGLGTSMPLSMNPFRPGIAVYGSFDGTTNGLLYADAPGTLLQGRPDAQRYPLDGGLGVLMVHFHNTVGNKAQVVSVKSTPPPAAKP